MTKNAFWDNPRIKNSLERFLIFIEIIIIIFCLFNLAFTGRVFPNTFVAGVNLGGKTKQEAAGLLSESVSFPKKIILNHETQNFEITPQSIDLRLDLYESVENAYGLYRTGNIIWDLTQRTASLFNKAYLGLRFTKDDNQIDQQISVIAGQIELDPIYPSIKYEDKQIVIEKGKIGHKLDRDLLKIKIGAGFAFANDSNITIPLIEIDPTLTDEEVNKLRVRAEGLLAKTLELKLEDKVFTFKGPDLLKYIDPQDLYQNGIISQTIEEIANKVNRDPENSVFIFEDNRVREFKPSKDGIEVKKDLLNQMFIGNFRTLEETDQTVVSLTIPAAITPATVKTGDVNNLGINELIGRGVSYFAGSIPGRIHNVNLASSKFKGVLVAPGDTLSFNNAVGDISALTGYKQAYVIKDGKTVLGDGGGVCQVSTTLFRAALNAGLPILERTAHAYRVGYYEQHSDPGMDATVYGPTVDLKIKNDTDKHILIQTSIDNKNYMLAFEIYGTKDGRSVKISKPVLTNQVAPPPDVYQDDPTLPSGKIVQTEHRAWGATVKFNYSVEKNGQIIYQKIFTSNFRPWGNVYLRGTAQ